MLNDTPFYHGIIRKTVIAFGHLFSNIHIVRREDDSVNGTAIQTLHIPIAYAPKEKWLVRIDQNPNLENSTYISLPRMSFEITGYNYDSQRKVGKMQKLICQQDGQAESVFSPVPYNLDFSLYVLTKTQEDAMQIVEQILPTFAPEYTIAINAIPDMNVIQDIPILLNSIQVSDEYDGDFQTRRFVTHTLTFTAKINLFGNVSAGKPIYTSIANVGTNSDGSTSQTYTAEGDPDDGSITETWVRDL